MEIYFFLYIAACHQKYVDYFFRNRFCRFHWKYFEILLLGYFEDRVSHSYKIVTSSNIRSYNPQARCRFQCHTIGERGLVLLQFTAKEHSIPQKRHTTSTRMPRMGWRACIGFLPPKNTFHADAAEMFVVEYVVLLFTVWMSQSRKNFREITFKNVWKIDVDERKFRKKQI